MGTWALSAWLSTSFAITSIEKSGSDLRTTAKVQCNTVAGFDLSEDIFTKSVPMQSRRGTILIIAVQLTNNWDTSIDKS